MGERVHRPRAGRLVAAVAMVLAAPAAVLATPAVAQDDPARTAQSGERMRFEIPAGPLAPALNRFAETAGLAMTFDPELAAGRTTNGVSGTYTVRAGLERLLAGTGLRAQAGDADTVRLVRGRGDRLETISVEAAGAAADVTRDTGYVPQRSISASGTNAPILDTPKAVSVVTEAVIEDQGNRELDDVLRNVPSVGRIANEGNVGGQNDITLRGFQTDRIFKNGFRIDNTGGPFDLANVARVEVVRGPASILYGAVSPGGIINAITRRPQPEPSLSLSVEGDEFGRSASTFNATGPVTADGSLMYALTLEKDQGDFFINRNEVDDSLVSGSLRWLATDRLTLDFHAELARDTGTFQFGIPFRGGEPDRRIPVERFLGETFNDKENEDTFLQTRGSYLIGDASELRWQLGWFENELDVVAVRPLGGQSVAADDTFGRLFSLRDDSTEQTQLDLDFLTTRRWLGVDHEVLVSLQHHESDGESGAPSGNNFNVPRVNVLAPAFGQVGARELIEDPAFAAFAPDAGTDTEQTRLLLQDSAWVTPRLKLLAGVSYTDVEQEVLFPSFGLDQKNSGDDVLPSLGALYKLGPETSIYASYAESLEPQFGANPDGESFDATEADQIEVGFKRSWGDQGFFSVAAYELTKTNIAEPIGDGSGFSRLVGEVRSQGLELEGAFDLPWGLRLDANYSFIDSEILTAGNPNEGNSNANVPENRASVWLVGDIIDNSQRRLEAGAGVFHVDERFVSSANDKKLPEHTVVDLKLSHEWRLAGGEGLELQLNLFNAFDERHFEGGFTGAAQPGPPRTLFARLTWRR